VKKFANVNHVKKLMKELEFLDETVEGTTAIAITDPPLPDLKSCPVHHTGSYRLIINSFNDTDDRHFVSNLEKDEYRVVLQKRYENVRK